MEKEMSCREVGRSHWPINSVQKTQPNRRNGSFMARLVISVMLLVWLSYSAILRLFEWKRLNYERSPKTWNTGDNKDFEKIVPSEKLEWHPCYDNFYCARLTVPMDYNRPLTEENSPKVHIALVLAPGAHSGPKKFSTSPLLINPGGPGGSGTTFALAAAEPLRTILGDPEQDIIGFDPRGIAATTPRADCFAYPIGLGKGGDYLDEDYITGNYHRMLWQNSGVEIGHVNSSSDSLLKLVARAKSVAKLCQEKDDVYGNESILRHAHTPNVARDMISIIDAWDEWTNSTSRKPNPCNKEKISVPITSENTSVFSTKSKLVYWGFSYGTLLGATFAAMFPDRVGRIVLDGVVDADLYVSPIWTESIQDADAIYDSFSTFCFQAGEECALYRASDKSAVDIADRFESIMADIKEHPLTLVSQWKKIPYVITHSVLRQIMFSIMYFPNIGFPVAALIANFLYYGHGEVLGETPYLPELEALCGPQPPAYAFPNEAQPAIMCSDKRYPLNETVPELQLRFEQLANISSWADVWLSVMLECEGWSIKAVDPPMRWDDHPAHTRKLINTSFPLLFVSNTLDPVTPLAAGLKMAKKFNGAGLIEQQSEGHCSISCVSLCTITKLRAYFTEGIVPPPPTDDEWVKCAADEWPWHPYDGTALSSASDVKLEAIQALKQVQEVFYDMDQFGQGRRFTPMSFQWLQKLRHEKKRP